MSQCWICTVIQDYTTSSRNVANITELKKFCGSNGLHIIQPTDFRLLNEDSDVKYFRHLLLQFTVQNFHIIEPVELFHALERKFGAQKLQLLKRKFLEYENGQSNDLWSIAVNWVKQKVAARQSRTEICSQIGMFIEESFQIYLNFIHLPKSEHNDDSGTPIITHIANEQNTQHRNIHILHDYAGVPWIGFVPREKLFDSKEEYFQRIIEELKRDDDKLKNSYDNFFNGLTTENVIPEVQLSLTVISKAETFLDLAAEYIMHCIEPYHYSMLELLVNQSKFLKPESLTKFLECVKVCFRKALLHSSTETVQQKIDNEKSTILKFQRSTKYSELEIKRMSKNSEMMKAEIPVLERRVVIQDREAETAKNRMAEAKFQVDLQQQVICREQKRLEVAQAVYNYKIKCSQATPSYQHYLESEKIIDSLSSCKSTTEIAVKIATEFNISPPAGNLLADKRFCDVYKELILIFKAVLKENPKEQCNVKYEEGMPIVVVTGKDIHIGDDLMTKLVKMKADYGAKEIRVIAARVIYLRACFKKEDWHGINIALFGRDLWLGSFTVISTSGKTSHEFGYGSNGNYGESAGNIYIEMTGKIIKRCEWRLEANGGNGSDGRNGSNGCKGADGIIGRSVTCSKPSYGELRKWIDPPEGSPGRNGGVGGDAGLSGRGGNGGDIQVISADTSFGTRLVKNLFQKFILGTISNSNGNSGRDGLPGKGAPGGEGGKDGQGHYWAFQKGYVYNGYVEKRGHYKYTEIRSSWNNELTGYDLEFIGYPQTYPDGKHGSNGRTAAEVRASQYRQQGQVQAQQAVNVKEIKATFQRLQKQFLPSIKIKDGQLKQQETILNQHKQQQISYQAKYEIKKAEFDKAMAALKKTRSKIEQNKDDILKNQERTAELINESERLKLDAEQAEKRLVELHKLLQDVLNLFDENEEARKVSQVRICEAGSDSESHSNSVPFVEELYTEGPFADFTFGSRNIWSNDFDAESNSDNNNIDDVEVLVGAEDILHEQYPNPQEFVAEEPAATVQRNNVIDEFDRNEPEAFPLNTTDINAIELTEENDNDANINNNTVDEISERSNAAEAVPSSSRNQYCDNIQQLESNCTDSDSTTGEPAVSSPQTETTDNGLTSGQHNANAVSGQKKKHKKRKKKKLNANVQGN